MPTGSTGAIRQGRAFVELFTDDTKLKQGLRKAENAVRKFGADIAHAGVGLMAAGASILAPLGLAVREYAKTGSELKEMSERTGVAVETLSELKYVASQTGASMEDLEKGIRLSQKVLGSSLGAKALAGLGIDAAKLKALSPEEQFLALAEHISKIPDQADRASAAMKLFGRGGASLLPMLNQGREGIAKLREEARRLGLVMSDADATAAHEFDNSLSRVKQQVMRLVGSIGASLVPTLNDFGRWLSRTIPQIRQFVETHRGWIVIIAMAAMKAVALGTAIYTVGKIVASVRLAFVALRVAVTVVAGTFAILTGGTKVLSVALAILQVSSVRLAFGLFSLRTALTAVTAAMSVFSAVGLLSVRTAIQATLNAMRIMVAVGLFSLRNGLTGIASIITGQLAVAFAALRAGLVGAVGAISGFASAIGLTQALVALWPALLVGAIVALLYFTGGFRELGAVFKQVWGGISDAIAAGDIALAMKILWAGIRVIWTEGVNYVLDFFTSMLTGILQVLAFIGGGILVGVMYLVQGIHWLWTELWTRVANGWTETWSRLNTGIIAAKNWLHLMSDEEAAAAIKAEVETRTKTIAERQGTRAAEHAEDAQRVEDSKQAIENRINDLQKWNDEVVKAHDAESEKRRQELADLIAEAKAKKEAMKVNPEEGPTSHTPAQPDIAGGAARADAVTGGFDIGALMSFQASESTDHLGRIAIATEKTADLLEKQDDSEGTWSG